MGACGVGTYHRLINGVDGGGGGCVCVRVGGGGGSVIPYIQNM